MSKLPNFLIVGAPKCGTTALYRYLGVHPEVYMPEVKEPYYFIKPKEGIGIGPKDLSYRNFVDDENEYRQLFSGVTNGHRAIGEASAGYLYFHEEAIPQIKKMLGDVKIIILIRDPVARAFSSHLHHRRGGRENESFETAWKLQKQRERDGFWFGFRLRDVGLYARSIAAYQSAFTDVQVILNEDLQRNTTRIVKDVFRFLEVDSSCPIDDIKRHNVNFFPRSEFLSRILNRLRRSNKVPKKFVNWMEKSNSYKPKLPMQFAKSIVSEFQSDAEETGKLINRDLSGWLGKYK